jgi:acyl-CoA thioester hydrolase
MLPVRSALWDKVRLGASPAVELGPTLRRLRAMSSEAFTPSPLAFPHRLRVAEADIDELGHANNVVWVRWIQEAARAHAEHVGMGHAAGLGLDVTYLAPAFVGEELTALTWPHTLKGASSLRRTLFVRDDKLLARAETTWAMVDARTGRPTRVPAAVIAAYGVGE